MKIPILSASLALALAASVWAADPVPVTTDSLQRDIRNLSEQLRESTEKMADLQKRLDDVEKRLGESYGSISPFDTVERRLDELEKDVDRLKR
ncbi:MAG TPA: hypothetical protein DCM68_06130 [Verrucomicrobia bacterium]|nr:hypothetical protein [Verrucomicrobiota bacterium]